MSENKTKTVAVTRCPGKNAGKEFMATGFLSLAGGKIMSTEQKAALLDAGAGNVRTATVHLTLDDGTPLSLVVRLGPSKSGGVMGRFALRIPVSHVELGTAPAKGVAAAGAGQDAFDALLASIK